MLIVSIFLNTNKVIFLNTNTLIVLKNASHLKYKPIMVREEFDTHILNDDEMRLRKMGCAVFQLYVIDYLFRYNIRFT